MASSERSRVWAALAATEAAAPDRLRAQERALVHLQSQAGLAPASTRQDAAGDPLALAARHLDAVRAALAARDRLAADLPRLAALAEQERRQARGPVVLIGLLVVIVLAVVIGQLL